MQSGKCEWIFKNNSGFANHPRRIIFNAMSSVQEIEAVIPKLSRAEVEEVRAWIDDFLEDQLELTDDVKAKLDQSRRELSSRIRQRASAWKLPDDASRVVAENQRDWEKQNDRREKRL
ncbi:MAG TPA: hypothetical protein VGH42_12275 [Verrucomicrobiae bacterium]